MVSFLLPPSLLGVSALKCEAPGRGGGYGADGGNDPSPDLVFAPISLLEWRESEWEEGREGGGEREESMRKGDSE